MQIGPSRPRPRRFSHSLIGASLVAMLFFDPTSPTLSAMDEAVPQIATSSNQDLFSLMEERECGWWDLAFAQNLRAKPFLTAVRNLDGETLLHVAARKCYENEVLLLLVAGADVNAVDKHGRTPLHLVAGLKREDAWMIRDMLALKKANLDARTDNGDTPLMVATKANDQRTIEFLVWMGASLKAPAADAASLGDIALDAGNVEAAALLADSDDEPAITINAKNHRIPNYIARAFTDAAAKKDYALLSDLMIDGVDINTRDPDGATALHRAVYRAHEDVVTFLLMLGANPDLTDKNGNTPYMAASSWFGLSMDWMRAMLLLSSGKTTEPINQRGFSPLDAAVHAGNEESAQLLIWAGADSRIETGDQGTPMTIACRAGSQRLIDLLRRNGVTEPEFVDADPQLRLEQYVKRGLTPQALELV